MWEPPRRGWRPGSLGEWRKKHLQEVAGEND
jgi:hypothetical protein